MSGGERFTLLTSEDPELPETFRIRISPPPFASKKKFQLLLSVVWQYSKLANSGMPKESVVPHMDQLETALMPAFESVKEGFLATIGTGSGVREWQFYVRDSDRAIEIVNATLGKLEPFPVSFHFDDDPDWEAYESLRPSTKSR